MNVNADKMIELAEKEGWSTPELANQLGVEYSYLYRVLKKKKNGGAKLFNGLYQLCKEKNLDVEEYIFLQKPLSTNNDKRKVI